MVDESKKEMAERQAGEAQELEEALDEFEAAVRKLVAIVGPDHLAKVITESLNDAGLIKLGSSDE